jgi:hypothetical protein
MKWSKECLKLAELCWEDNEIRSTNVFVGETYTDKEGIKYKISENVYDELMEYQIVAERKFNLLRPEFPRLYRRRDEWTLKYLLQKLTFH